jgi:hypothetical protein
LSVFSKRTGGLRLRQPLVPSPYCESHAPHRPGPRNPREIVVQLADQKDAAESTDPADNAACVDHVVGVDSVTNAFESGVVRGGWGDRETRARYRWRAGSSSLSNLVCRGRQVALPNLISSLVLTLSHTQERLRIIAQSYLEGATPRPLEDTATTSALASPLPLLDRASPENTAYPAPWLCQR